MRILVVYESMYGNTHQVAEAIARAATDDDVADVVPVGEATAERVAAADLVFAGGPTHVHGESSERTRAAARDQAASHDLDLDPDAAGPGLRDWLSDLADVSGAAAAFDTRLDGPPLLTGRASKGISRALRSHGFSLIAKPESFLVTKANTLVEGEDDRAERWAGTVISEVRSELSQAPSS